MSNIIELPDSMVRAWRVFERRVRAAMISAGCSLVEIDHACAELQPLYLRFAKPVDISGLDGEALVAEFNRWVREQIVGLLIATAMREVRIFRLTGGNHD